jgi:hypothetical protein
MAHRTHRRIARRGESAQPNRTRVELLGLRRTLIAALAGNAADNDYSYDTVRHGYVPSYRGAWVADGQLHIGYPATGTAGLLFRAGYVRSYPLRDVSTAKLVRLACLQGKISYETNVGS